MDATRPEQPDRPRASRRRAKPTPTAAATKDSAAVESPAVPDFEWVFGCITTLGRVGPTGRNTFYNGKPVGYAPRSELDGGARWCSQAWLDRDLGKRGFLARNQSSVSLFAMHVSGQIRGGTVVVVPDDQVEAAAALANRLLVPAEGEDTSSLQEWSMAVVREPGRSRLAVRLGPRFGFDDDVRALVAPELDVEWFIDFGTGSRDSGNENSEPDYGTVRSADGTVVAELGGVVYLEDEPIPSRLIEIAEKYGDGLTLVGRRSGAIILPTGSHRPLEPDEWDIDRDYQRWIG